jgi:hypothetical protein
VKLETFTAELNLGQPGEIEFYGKVFDTLAVDADYDRKARALLTAAAEQLNDRLNPGSGTEQF